MVWRPAGGINKKRPFLKKTRSSAVWLANKALILLRITMAVEIHDLAILSSQVECHPVLTVYPSMKGLAYGGKLYWFLQPCMDGVRFTDVKAAALARLSDAIEDDRPSQQQLSVFFVSEDASGPWLQFERTYAAHLLLCRLQRRVRAWLQRRRAWRLGFCALVVDAGRRTASAQRAVFGLPELRALVVHFLKGR
jgi:hypothetical protein